MSNDRSYDKSAQANEFWPVPRALMHYFFFFFFQAEDGIRDYKVTGVQTCALPISECRIPSVYEGFGIPPLEALACGRPVIASDLEVTREVLNNTATLTPVGNVDKIGRASCRERV